MDITVKCIMCEAPIADFTNVKEVKDWGTATCALHSSGDTPLIMDLYLVGMNEDAPEEIGQFHYDDNDPADNWKR